MRVTYTESHSEAYQVGDIVELPSLELGGEPTSHYIIAQRGPDGYTYVNLETGCVRNWAGASSVQHLVNVTPPLRKLKYISFEEKNETHT